MNEDLQFEGKTYISSRRAAREHGYTQDYIGQLIRGKKIDARKIGRSWFVSADSLAAYQQSAELFSKPKNLFTSSKLQSIPELSAIRDSIDNARIATTVEPSKTIETIKYLSDDRDLMPRLSKGSASIVEGADEVVVPATTHIKARALLRVSESKMFPKMMSILGGKVAAGVMTMSLIAAIVVSNAFFNADLVRHLVRGDREAVERESVNLAAAVVSNDSMDEEIASLEKKMEEGVADAVSMFEEALASATSYASDLFSGTRIVSFFSGETYPFAGAGSEIYETMSMVFGEARGMIAGVFGSNEELASVTGEAFVGGRSEQRGDILALESAPSSTVLAASSSQTQIAPIENYTIISGVTLAQVDQRIAESKLLDQSLTILLQAADRNLRNTRNGREANVTARIGGSTITQSEIKDSSITNSSVAATTLSASSANLSDLLFNTASGTNALATYATTTNLHSNLITVSDSIKLDSSAPLDTINRLYASGADLYWAGNLVAGAAVGNWTSDGTHTWRETGNVGVGTSSPFARLSVSAHNGGSTALFAVGTSTDAGATSTAFIIDAYGSVGINLSSPNPTDFGGGTLSFKGRSSGTTGTISAIGNNVLSTNPIGRLAFIHEASGVNTNVAFIQALRSGGDDGADLNFMTRQSGGSLSEKMRITSDGKVGIGTTSPGYALDVAGDINLTGNLKVNGSDAVFSNWTTVGSDIYRMSTVGIGTASPLSSTKLHVRSTSASTASDGIIRADSTATSGSNYGIVSAVNGSGADQNVGIFATANNGTQNRGIEIYGVLAGADNYSIYSNSPAKSYFEGSVGIGTTSPWAKLSVNPDGESGPLFAIGSSTRTHLLVTNGGNVAIGTSTIPSYTKLLVDGISRFTDGVSIGLDDVPGSYDLWINSSKSNQIGIQNLNASSQAQFDMYSDTGSVYFWVNGSSKGNTDLDTIPSATNLATYGGPLILKTMTAEPVIFATGGTANSNEVMRLGATGNVGIGTTSPFAKLSVAGNAYIGGSLVIGNSASSSAAIELRDPSGNISLEMRAGTSTLYNTLVGKNSGVAITYGGYNTALGHSALISNTGGSSNTAIGYGTLYTNTTGGQNVAVGNSVLANTRADGNTGVGAYSLLNTTTGEYNTAVGQNSMYRNITGSYNAVLGVDAIHYNRSATSTVAVGYRAGYGDGSFYYNQGSTYLGYQAGYSASSNSDFNTLLGYQAGHTLTTGKGNIVIGAATSSTYVSNISSGSQNILIGTNISLPSGTASGQLNIGNIIFGTGNTATGDTISTGNIGIGTSSPYAKLSVAGATVAEYFNATNTRATSTFMGGVGVGTSSPSATLSVQGQNSSIGPAPLAFAVYGGISGSAAKGGGVYMKTGRGAFGGGDFTVITGDSDDATGGAINLTAGSGLSSGSIGGSVNITAGGGSANYGTDGNVVINPGYTAGTGKILLGSTGGNVGIGTSSPYAKLSVAGSVVASNIVSTSTATSTFAGNVGFGTAGYSNIPGIDKISVLGGAISFLRSGNPDWGPVVGFDYDSSSDALRFRANNGSNTLNNTYMSIVRSTGNVGIGTTTPAYPLDVKVSGSTVARFSGSNHSEVLLNSGSGSNSGIFLQENFSNKIGLIYNSGQNSGGRIAQSFEVYGFNGSTPIVNVSANAGNSIYVNSSSYTGLGTTSPATRLSVYGSNGAASTINVNDTGYISTHSVAGNRSVSLGTNAYWNGSSYVTYNASESGMAMELHRGASQLRLGSVAAGGGALTVDASVGVSGGNTYFNANGGNVGIGTTTPSARLSVTGSGTGTGRAFAVANSSNSEVFKILDNGYVSIGPSTNTNYKLDVNGSVNLAIGEAYAIGGNRVLHISGSNNVFGGVSAGSTSVTGSSNVSFGTNSMKSITAGNFNVGVGAHALESVTSGGLNTALGHAALINATGSGNTGLGYSAGSNITSGSNNIVIGNNLDAPVATGSNQLNIGNIIFGTAIDGSFSTLSTGNIGIGTTSPFQKFSVTGNAYIGGNLTATGTLTAAGFALSGGSVNSMLSTNASGEVVATSTVTTNSIWATSSSAINYIAGTFGLGTTDPSLGGAITSKFTIIQSANQSALTVGTSTSYRVFALDPNTNGGFTLYDGGPGGNTWVGGVSQVNGSVGIGTSTPAGRLEIVQTSNTPTGGLNVYGSIDNATISITNAASGGKTWWLDSSGGGSSWGAGNLSIGTGATYGPTPVITFTQAGNVGIGTTSPSQALSVQGNGLFSGNVSLANLTATGTLQVMSSASSTFKGPIDFQTTDTILSYSTGNTLNWLLRSSNTGGGLGRSPALYTTDTRDDILLQPNGGQVLIGLSTPASGAGDNSISMSSNGGGIYIGNNAAYFSTVNLGGGQSVSPVLGSQDNRDYLFLQPSGGKVGIGTFSPSAKLSIAINGGTDPQFLIASSTGSGATTTSFMVDRFGNVGIGTTSPYAKLSVVGEAVARNFTATSTTATSTFAGGFDVGNGAIRYDFSSGITSIDNASIGSLNFETNAGIVNWTDMLVTSAATAGTIESYTASLNGNPMLTVYGESDGAGGIQNKGVGVGSTTPWAYFSINPDTIGGTRPLFAIGSSTASRLVVSNDGNVGIGTTSPYAKLSVSGSVVASHFIATTTAATSTFAGTVAIGQNYGGLSLAASSTALTVRSSYQGSNGLETGIYVDASPLSGALFATSTAVRTMNVPGTFANAEGLKNTFALYYSGRNALGVFNDIIGNDYDSNTVWGMLNRVGYKSAGNFYGVQNVINRDYGSDPGDTSNSYGVYNDLPTILSGTDGISNSYGTYTVGRTYAGGTKNFYGNYVVSGSDSDGGTQYGMYVDLSAGTATKYAAILKGGNVGIGTSTPGSTLNVKASNAVSTGGFRLTSSTNGNTVASIQDSGSGDVGLFTLSAAGTVKNQINSSGDSYFNGGNVGIGTTNINDRVSIDGGDISFIGSANRSLKILASNSNTAGMNLSLVAGNAGSSPDSDYNGGSVFLYGGTKTNSGLDGNVILAHTGSAARGNVGIGTTSPYSNLDIYGSTGLTISGSGSNKNTVSLVPGTASSYDRLDFKAVSANRGVSFQLNPNGTNSNSKITLANDASSSNFDSAFISVEGTSAFISPQRVGSGGSAGQISTLNIGGGSGAGSWTNVVVSSGNVGVGTTSPYAKLSVVGQVVATNIFATSTTATSTFAGGLDVGNGAIRYDFSSGATSIDNLELGNMSFEADAGVVTWADMPVTSSSANGVANSYTAALNGNPMLTVYGTSDGAGSLSNLGVGIGSTTPWGFVSINPNNFGSSRPLFAVGSSTASQFLIGSTGNIGIGTTSPAEKLSIAGTGTQRIMIQETGSNVRFKLGSASTHAFVSTESNNDLRLGTNNIEVLNITASGNVGIGTTTPQRLLHVYRSTDGAPVRFEDANGYCEIDPTSTSWTCTSDRSLKKDITQLSADDTMSRIGQLNAVSFRWNKDNESDPLRYGFIAQDVEAVFPELVVTADNGLKSVMYGGFTPFLVEAIKELKLAIDTISGRLDSIEGRLAALEMFAEMNGGFASSTASTTASTTEAVVSGWLSSMGVTISNAVSTFVSLVADTFSANFAVVNDLTVQNVSAASVAASELRVGTSSNPTAAGITILDRTTGAPFCFYIQNGVMQTQAGECSSSTPVVSEPAPATGSNSEPEPEPTVEQATTTEPTTEAPAESSSGAGEGTAEAGSSDVAEAPSSTESADTSETDASAAVESSAPSETVTEPASEPVSEPAPEPAFEPAPTPEASPAPSESASQ